MPDTDALVVLTTLGTSGGVRAHLAHPLLGEGVGHEVNA